MTIRELDTDLFPIAGTPLQISDAEPDVVPSEDGTVEADGEALEEGDTYTVTAYVPEPTPDQMRAAYNGPPERAAAGTRRCSCRPRRLRGLPVRHDGSDPRVAVCAGC